MIRPVLSIGLPVYNGENYLREAIDSLLSQTFDDFELIISDNASTDRTSEICQYFMGKDKRIRYFRSETNLGMHKNWNRVFELSSGKYFKWAAHDDLYAPQFLAKCVDILNQDKTMVLCSTRTKIIDEAGNFLRDYDVFVKTDSFSPHDRFYNMLAVDHWCFQIFGVIRSDVLAETPLHGYFFGSDRNLLAELSLRGRVYEVPEYLFLRRDHIAASARQASNHWERLINYNPTGASQTKFLGVRRIYEYAASIYRTPLGVLERLLCYVVLMRLMIEKVWHRFLYIMKPFLHAKS